MMRSSTGSSGTTTATSTAAPSPSTKSPPSETETTSTTTNNINDSNSSSSSSSNTDEEQQLFGSLATDLTDQLASNLTTALRKGIEKLPMLEDTQSLLQQLQKPYLRNIDLFELYCQRNIFSLQHFPPLQRHKIAQIYLDSTWDPSRFNTSEQQRVEEEESATTTQQQQQQPQLLPSKDQIPSPSKLQTAQQQLLGRRQHLDALRARRTALEKRVRELDAAQQLVDHWAATNALTDPNNNHDGVPQAVASTLQAGASATQLGTEGQALHQRMRDLKRQQQQEQGDDNDDDDAMIVVPAAARFTKKKKTVLTDRYEENRKALLLAAGDEGGNLDKVRALLRN